MAEPKGVFARRVFVEDARGNGAYLRATWHPDGRQFVLSHWHDDVCVAATRVPVEAVPQLVALLVNGLAETAGATAPTARQDRTTFAALVERLHSWLRKTA